MQGLFGMRFIGKEDHLLMPPLTKLVVTQSLYDILFQYMLTPEQEQSLLNFLNRIQKHLAENPYRRTPFSVRVDELEFLEEGIKELKLLCWQQAPVHLFEIDYPEAATEEERERLKDQTEQILAELFVYNWQGDDLILVYSTLPL